MVKFKLTRRQVVRQAAGLLFTLTPIASALAKAAPPAQFVAARIWPSHAYTRITIESSRALQYQHFALENPGRLVIDIQNANINSVLQGISGKVLPDDPYIRSIRAGQNTPTTVRVVIDLKQNAYPQVFSLAPVGGFKNRLVIDLYPHGVDANDPMMALLNGNPPKRMQTQRPTERTNIAQDTPPRSNRGGRRPVVMIDPGHGGEDPGAIGPSGLKEKNVVLSIAREAKNRLESIGYTVYMTRNEDIFIPLGVRVAKARARHADAVVSIPENLDPTQTEVLRAYFAYERATRRLWFRNEGLDTMDTVATGQLLTEIKHNAAKTNGQLSRPPVRISVSEVSASEDGNGYAIAACLDKTQMTTVDAQGNDNTNPKIQTYKPIIAFMTQGTDGTWRASQEDSGTPNTCSVN